MTDAYPDVVRSPAESPGARRAGRIGRRFAIAFYWSLLIYLAVVGFASVIPQVFSPYVDPRARAELPESCHAALHAQHHDLLAHMSDSVGGDHDTRFWQAWDRRHHALASDCDDGDHYKRLSRLRYRIETSLHRFRREEGAVSDALARELGETRDSG